jgi:hypothetical protein
MRAWKIALLVLAAAGLVVAAKLLLEPSSGESGTTDSSTATPDARASSAGQGASASPAAADATAASGKSGEDVAPTITGAAADGARGDDELAPCDPLVIHGRVSSAASGEPIVGAEVAAERRFEGAVRTDESGDYSLRIPTVSFYELKVEARASGFGRREVRVGEFLGTDLTVDLELMPARRAAGRLVDPDGGPVVGADVSAHASLDGSEGDMIDRVESRSAGDGSFVLADLRPDLPHLLRVGKPGFATLVYAFPQDEKAIDVVEFGELVIPREHVLEIVVADDGEAPLEGVHVSIYGGNADWLRFSSAEPRYNRRDLWDRRGDTDASGRCRFEGLAAGTWSIGATRRDRTAANPLEITIAEGDAVVPLRITMPRGLSIAGRVVDEDGRRVAKASVYVSRADGGALWLHADDLGEFRAQGLEAGDYRLTTDDSWFAMFEEDEGAKSGVVVAAGREDVVLVSKPAPTEVIRGIVRDRDGKAVALASVKAFVRGGREMGIGMQSRVGGRFALTVPKGARVTLIAGPRDAWPRWKEDGTYDLTGFPTVEADATSGEVTVTWFDPNDR